MRQLSGVKGVPCVKSMKNMSCVKMSGTKHWLPEQDPEPGTEVKAGDLYLLSTADSTCRKRVTRYPVHVKVYRSCSGHYAVVTAGLRAPATFLNLRSSRSRPCLSGGQGPDTRPCRFRVELGGGEGQVICFEVGCRDSSVEEWVRAFQGWSLPSAGTLTPTLTPSIPRSPILPTLQESTEEEEEHVLEEQEEEGEEEVLSEL